MLVKGLIGKINQMAGDEREKEREKGAMA